MAQPLVGALRVTLGLNSAEFSKGLKRADKAMADFSRRMAVAGKAMAVAVTAGAAGLSAAVVKTSKLADELGKVAQSVGMSVESLSELRHAADMSGASFEALQTGMRRFAQTIGDAIAMPTSEGAKALDSLGMSVLDADGKLKSTEQLLGEVADAFSRLEDGALKVDAAMAIFGRSGTALIPMLNQGSFGIAQMAKEARNLGLVISEDTFRSAEAFNDNLSRLRKLFQGVVIQMTAGVLPAFRNLTDRLVEALTQSDALKRVSAALSAAMSGLASAITIVFNNLDTLFDLFKVFVAAKLISFVASISGAFITVARTIKSAGLALAAFNLVSKISVGKIAVVAGAIAMATGQFEALEKRVASFASTILDALPDSLKQTGQAIVDGLNIDADDKRATKSLAEYLATQNDVNASLVDTNALVERLRSGTAGASAAAENVKDAWAGLRDSANSALESFNQGLEFSKNMARGFFSDLSAGLETGKGIWESFADAALNALRKITNALMNSAINQLFSGTTGAGGFFGSLFAPMFPAAPAAGALNGFAGLFADGGKLSAGQWGIVGEEGPEIVRGPAEVVPMRSIHDQAPAAANANYAPTYNITVNGDGMSARAVADLVVQSIADYDRNTAPQTIMRTQKRVRRWT